jgi:hypothetical protein
VALTFEFAGELIEWRGPAPFYYVAIPAEVCAEIKEAAKVLSYGWGVVPVRATIGATDYTTSLFPKAGAYLLPVKNAVRLPEKLELGQLVEVELTLGS